LNALQLNCWKRYNKASKLAEKRLDVQTNIIEKIARDLEMPNAYQLYIRQVLTNA
jgi:hypothetical protein